MSDTTYEELARRVRAGERMTRSQMTETEWIMYTGRPCSTQAAREETDPLVLERWARTVTRKPQFWQYREVLAANPHMPQRGRDLLAKSARYAHSTRGRPSNVVDLARERRKRGDA